MVILTFIFGYLYGFFALSNIIFPIFYSIPKSIQLHKSNKLIKRIPLIQLVAPSILWALITLGLLWLIHQVSPGQQEVFLSAMLFALVSMLFQVKKTWRDLELDFNSTWREYLKDS
ncbi:TPA: hypothetical protein DEP34_03220 [Candidatus Uhrbacteria bacterium]|nr:MAG: hypothetical protein A2X89_11820 [Deltaproteobacteria bacterium GWD2_55_8]HBK33785.1 hypothetical protein [Candidatus Uhrbacteria bacterium]HCB19374.1 hypothetical protein [Candidatus Uhrbacteria bacterium]